MVFSLEKFLNFQTPTGLGNRNKAKSSNIIKKGFYLKNLQTPTPLGNRKKLSSGDFEEKTKNQKSLISPIGISRIPGKQMKIKTLFPNAQ